MVVSMEMILRKQCYRQKRIRKETIKFGRIRKGITHLRYFFRDMTRGLGLPQTCTSMTAWAREEGQSPPQAKPQYDRLGAGQGLPP